MKLAFAYISLILAWSLPATLVGQEPDILGHYLIMAVDNNPGVKASFQQYYAALEQIPQVSALPDPEVMLGYFISPVETRVGPRRFDIQLSQSFPWFGTLEAQKDQASKEAESQYAVFLSMKNDLFYQVKEVYYMLYANSMSTFITQAHLEILGRDERVTLNRVEAGRASIADVLRVQMEIKENQTMLEFYKDRNQTLTAEFNALLDRSPFEEVALPDTLITGSILMDSQALMDSIISKNPEIQGLHKQQEALQSKVEVAKKYGKPSFKLGINYATITPRTDTEMVIPGDGQDVLMPMAAVSIPLYRKKYKAMVKEANLQKESINMEIANTQNMLQSSLIEAINAFKDSERKVSLYQQLMIQAQQTLNILTEAYIGGQKDYEEVLRIEQQLLRYRLALESAKANLNISVALVEKLWAKNI